MFGALIPALYEGYRAQRASQRAALKAELSYIRQLPPEERTEAMNRFVAEQRIKDEMAALAAENELKEHCAREARRRLEEAANRTYRDPTSDFYDPWLVMEERLGLRGTSTFEQAVARWAE